MAREAEVEDLLHLPGPDPVDPPEGLSDEAASWWREVCGSYALEPHHIRLLEAACREWDTAQEADRIVRREGLRIEDRFGQVQPHPLAAVGRQARNAFRLLCRELGLDVSPSTEPRVAPPPGGR
ncbi:MAG: hypothetical protein EA417_00895 [Gammaproteobacteria bacterium]|nr:MAG: hypothetical protein EA417_00895 [Gammaproteobacteria bacterium]